uniref:Uncharacterized protein n=1 Tax=Anguilla anguilla TaxID=7936 RepID=A0A0E9XRF3_ANGAN
MRPGVNSLLSWQVVLPNAYSLQKGHLPSHSHLVLKNSSHNTNF